MPSSPLRAGEVAPPDQPAADLGTPGSLDLLTREAAGGRRPLVERLAAVMGPARWPVAVYAGSRLLLLVVAGVVAVAGHRAIGSEFFLFDGKWYLALAEHGYPTQALHAKSTLGFFPLYPLVIRAVAGIFMLPVPAAALVTSVLGGLAAVILVSRLATAWWGEAAGRRATMVFCLFPGSVVFSMSYSECLTIPLAAGCLLALRARRWWVAGLAAGLATAVEPVALVLVVVCAAAGAGQVRRHGWRDPAARRSLMAPLLAPAGIGGFGVFLWVWTGTPWAAYLAQHYGWHEQNQPLALLSLPITRHLTVHPAELIEALLAWNIWNGLLGAVFLVLSIVALVRVRRQLSTGTLIMTIGIAAVTLWSVLTPPNARMLLIAFPAVLVWGYRLAGRSFRIFVIGEALLLAATSALTFSGHMLPLSLRRHEFVTRSAHSGIGHVNDELTHFAAGLHLDGRT